MSIPNTNSGTVLAVNVNDINNNNNLFAANYAIRSNNVQPSISTPYIIPPVIIPNKQGKVNFNRTLLIIPLIAFLLVSAIAITAGVVYSILTNQNVLSDNNLMYDNNFYLTTSQKFNSESFSLPNPSVYSGNTTDFLSKSSSNISKIYFIDF